MRHALNAVRTDGLSRARPAGRVRAAVRASLSASLGALLVLGASMGGCENAGQGAVSGAGIGALSGLAIGSMTGNAGKGAAIGAIAGGVGGAAIGDQNRRNQQNAQTVARAQGNVVIAPPVQQPAPVTATPPPANTPGFTSADRDRTALAKFARTWRIVGWETVDGQRRVVSGTAVGTVENAFFVRLAMNMTDEMTGRINSGSIILASEPGRGITLNSRFDTSPSPAAYTGSVSADGSVLTLDEVGAPGDDSGSRRRIVMRFLAPDSFVADVTERRDGQSTPMASFNFSQLR